jgi:hypothetical protein
MHHVNALPEKSKEQLLKAAKEMENKPFSLVWIRSMSFLEMLCKYRCKCDQTLGIAERSPTTAEDSKPNLKVLKHRPRELAGTCFTGPESPAADVSSAAPPLKSSSLQDAETVDSSELSLFRLEYPIAQKP